MYLHNVVLPIRGETVSEVIQEEETTEENQKSEEEEESRKSISIRIPEPQEAAAMVVFNSTRRPSMATSKQSTQQSKKHSQKSKQSSQSTAEAITTENIFESPASTASTFTDLRDNPTTSSAVLQMRSGGRPIRSRTIGQFADSPSTLSGRVVGTLASALVISNPEHAQYAIAACQDDQCVFDMDKIGGLLTSVRKHVPKLRYVLKSFQHFVDYMSQLDNPKQSTLSKLVDHLWYVSLLIIPQ
jgi:hypothetical protein